MGNWRYRYWRIEKEQTQHKESNCRKQIPPLGLREQRITGGSLEPGIWRRNADLWCEELLGVVGGNKKGGGVLRPQECRQELEEWSQIAADAGALREHRGAGFMRWKWSGNWIPLLFKSTTSGMKSLSGGHWQEQQIIQPLSFLHFHSLSLVSSICRT